MDSTAAPALFAWLDRELWLLTARAGQRRGGLIATFVAQASLVPDLPRVVVGVAKQHATWELIESSDAFALHLLGQHNLDWVERFGLASGRQVDKFAGTTPAEAATGSPILDGAIGWLDCRVEARLDTGDRTVYLGGVVESQVTHHDPPLTLKQMLQRLPATQVAELKRLMHHDSSVDAQAIVHWRRQHGIDTPHEP
jgi:flavin reductase (DIM6/NTAB) family NADH-FMN oxidoreductase RutF